MGKRPRLPVRDDLVERASNKQDDHGMEKPNAPSGHPQGREFRSSFLEFHTTARSFFARRIVDSRMLFLGFDLTRQQGLISYLDPLGCEEALVNL